MIYYSWFHVWLRQRMRACVCVFLKMKFFFLVISNFMSHTCSIHHVRHDLLSWLMKRRNETKIKQFFDHSPNDIVAWLCVSLHLKTMMRENRTIDIQSAGGVAFSNDTNSGKPFCSLNNGVLPLNHFLIIIRHLHEWLLFKIHAE